VGDSKNFKNGRQAAAWAGLVPRQDSSGGKERLLGISKRGDVYLRTLLIHGARSVVKQLERRLDRGSTWLKGVIARRNKNVAAVALANKNMRTAWALLAKGCDYEADHVSSAKQA
jgi:transposase